MKVEEDLSPVNLSIPNTPPMAPALRPKGAPTDDISSLCLSSNQDFSDQSSIDSLDELTQSEKSSYFFEPSPQRFCLERDETCTFDDLRTEVGKENNWPSDFKDWTESYISIQSHQDEVKVAFGRIRRVSSAINLSCHNN